MPKKKKKGKSPEKPPKNSNSKIQKKYHEISPDAVFYYQLDKSTPGTYMKFIKSVTVFCSAKKDDGDPVKLHDCYVLPVQAKTEQGKRKLLYKIVVIFTHDSRKISLGLFFTSDNLYYLAYSIARKRYHFEDKSPICPKIKRSTCLNFDSGYTTLKRITGKKLEDVFVGRKHLLKALEKLVMVDKEGSNDWQRVADSTLTILFHFPEPMRFHSLASHVFNNYLSDDDVPVGATLAALANQWSNYSDALSKASQESVSRIMEEIRMEADNGIVGESSTLRTEIADYDDIKMAILNLNVLLSS